MHDIHAGVLEEITPRTAFRITYDPAIDYFGQARLGLNRKIISSLLDDLNSVAPVWDKLIEICFLPDELKKKYRLLLNRRWESLFAEPQA